MNRRQFLRGLGGVTIALPFLESVARAQATTTKRLVVFFTCNGVDVSRFWPSALTPEAMLGTGVEPLTAFRHKLLIPRGIDQSPSSNDGTVPGNEHEKGIGTRLTAETLSPDGDHYALGVSVDQYAAQHINPAGRSALTLKVHESKAGVLGCISYAGPNRPVVGEPNPANAFRNLVGLNESGPAAAIRRTRRKSVLDFVRDDLDALKRKNLSKSDTDKLDLHTTSLRDIEVSLDQLGLLQCTAVDANALGGALAQIDPATVTSGAEFKRIGRLQLDLIAATLACDQTRVATLLWGAGSGGPVFSWDGMNHQYNHHKLSHGSTSDDNTGSAVEGYLDMIHAIDRWYAAQFAYLLEKLDAYAEPTGTVLDNSVIAWMNDLSDGRSHLTTDLPVVLAGSGGGVLKQGQYVQLANAPHNQLLTTLLNAVGVPTEHFGGTQNGQTPGRLSDLVVS
jgi:hypothetical protein